MDNVCIIGLGSIGRRHAKVLKQKGVEKIIGVDVRDDRIAQAKEETEISHFSKSFTEVFANHQVSTVFITLPTAYHTEIIRESVLNNCNVFIEKPIAAVSDGLDEIHQDIKARNLNSHVAYCYRFAPSVERLKQIVDSKLLGKVFSARLHISTYLPDWHPWEDYRDFYMAKMDQGGGARLDESHGIDLLRWLFGEVSSVFSTVDTVSDLEITSDDLTTMILKFQSGLIAEAHFDLLGRTPRIGLELIGSEGTLVWDRIDGTIKIYDAKTKKWETEDFGKDDFVKSYDRQAEYVIDCFKNNRSSDCDFEDGVKTLRVLEGALESSSSRKMIDI
ncbi:Gfo/Idh/MocA family oxidoreductase [Candidatus Puniceispirillum sp.]|nr:Gfo/Idh/MocA family oxidoreductase [Alphaproteobacteria bacterium]MDC1293903.1 Gfo/Idh/MocA family oxidoreductase [Candidatus Puniceispirillum sp.]